MIRKGFNMHLRKLAESYVHAGACRGYPLYAILERETEKKEYAENED